MLKRIRRHLSPPMVLSTAAVFVALGGSHAIAFKGSGTLQKGGAELTSSTSFQTVRTLTGIGSILARCPNDADDGLDVRFNNSSGEQLSVSVLSEDSQLYERFAPTNNTNVDRSVPEGDQETIRIGVSPASGKAPAADVLVQVNNAQPECGTVPGINRVHVLALNTEE